MEAMSGDLREMQRIPLAPTHVAALPFKKDIKRIIRRGYRFDHFNAIVTAIRLSERLPVAPRPHPLKGEWKSYWECHIAADWLLIYRATDAEVLLARTGTHADLFEG
jgi:mRNA interferase YafQ